MDAALIAFKYKQVPAPRLFPLDRRFRSFAETRTHVGEFFENLTAEVTGAKRIRIDGTREICPDLHWYDSTFIECKGVGKNNSVIIYEGRMERDLQLVGSGNSLYYWIWKHESPCQHVEFLSALHASLEETVAGVIVLPLRVLHDLSKERPLRVLNTAYTKAGARLGYGFKKGYGKGWSIPLSLLRTRCLEQTSFPLFGRQLQVHYAI